MLRKISLLLVVVLLLFVTATRQAAADDQQFQQCNALYAGGDFSAAVDCYQQIEQTSRFSFGLNYNLANAYAQLGKVGPAVLNYERAHRLAPRDGDIGGNLAFIRQESGLFAPERSTFETLLDSIGIDKAAQLLLVSLFLLTATALLGLKFNSRRKVLIRSSATVFGLSCVFAIFLCWKNYQTFNPSVVIVPDAKLLISPFDGAGAVGAMQEGRLVYPGKTHGDYVFIRAETGRTGWLPNNAITAVIPKG